MAEDLPGPPDGGNPDQRPGDRPTEAAGYAPAGYEYQPTQQTEPLATVALVIAIAGFFVCPPVAAIVALILANSARQRIQASGRHLGGLEQVKAARIIAIVELILSAIVVLVLAISAVVALNQQRTGLDEPVPVDSTRAWAPSSWSTAASSGGSGASLGSHLSIRIERWSGDPRHSVGQSGHSRGHSTSRNAPGQNRTRRTSPPT
jgi:hypothetical protein